MKALAFALLLIAPAASAAVLYSNAGPLVATGGGDGTSIVNTGNDTGDWITAGGYDTGSNSGALYFQFTANVTNNAGETGAGGFFTALQFYDGGERFAVGNFWSSVNWSGFFGPGEYNLTGNPAIVVGTPVNFVVKLEQALNQATVYFNPNLALTEGAQAAGNITVRGSLAANDEFQSINIRAGNGTGSTTFSNIVIRDDSPFAPIPEPASLMGLLTAAGLLVARRRR